jgi:hypothetical protein
MGLISILFEKILKGQERGFCFANVNHLLSWILLQVFDLVEVFHVSLNSRPLKTSSLSKLLLTATQVGSGLGILL